MHSTRPITLFKLGGSLLDLPHLGRRVRNLIALRSDRALLFVVGGGVAADVVRHWQPAQNLSDEQAHWLAIEAMGLNEELLQTLLPELRLIRSGPQFNAASKDNVPALACASCFVRWGEASGLQKLPRDWRVTSDSIAAWTAQAVGAAELVLVKSRPLEPLRLDEGQTLEKAASTGLVDQYFPEVAKGLPAVNWCNGRADPLQIQSWLTKR